MCLIIRSNSPGKGLLMVKNAAGKIYIGRKNFILANNELHAQTRGTKYKLTKRRNGIKVNAPLESQIVANVFNVYSVGINKAVIKINK